MIKLRRLNVVILCSLLGAVLGLVLVANHGYQHGQRQLLETKYQLLRQTDQRRHLTAAQLTHWQQQQQVQVVRLNRKNNVTYCSAHLPRQTGREILPGVLQIQARTGQQGAVVLQIQQRDYLSYVGVIHGDTMILLQHQHAIWQPFWQRGVWLLIATLVVAGCLTSFIWWWCYRPQRSLRRIQQQMTQIRRDQTTPAVLLPPDDPYYPLAKGIRQLDQRFRRLEVQAQAAEANFNRFVRHLPVGVLLIDDRGQVLQHNQVASDLLQQSIPNAPHSYLQDVQDPQLGQLIHQAYLRKKSQHQTLTLLQQQQVVDANAVWMPNEAGPTAYRVALLLYDMTEIHQLQQMQLDFVGNVSHELKTPVTAISGFSETLLAGAQDDPATRQQFLEIIDQESKRLAALIQDILALSRGERQFKAPQQLAVSTLIHQVQQPLMPQITAKKLVWTEHLWADLQVNTQRDLLEPIVKNLLVNAIVYNREGGTVTVTTAQQGSTWTLQVADTGIGIKTAEQQRIFERFYRVDKARSRHQGGTGLGLAIVQAYVQRLGGKIAVTSQYGVGTTFTVTLPI